MAEICPGIATNLAQNLAQRLVDGAIKEARYLCCYKSYVKDFEKGKKSLSATRSRVLKDIQEARKRNETEIEPEVQLWLDNAKSLIEEANKTKEKWFFGLCTNCYWQHQRAEELEGKTQEISKLIEESRNFPQVARSTGLPGIEFHALSDFIHFKSRESNFEKLKEALKDESMHVIGLQGMGGTGKTTMVKEVGYEFQKLKLFDIVIFAVVSNPPNVKTIQGDIARHLGFPLTEEESRARAEKLWDRIVKGEEKILIILDDIWDKELSLKDIGIPLGRHGKGRCSVLLTTRDMNVCKAMKCQEIIKLELLAEEDALNLLLSHAGKSGNNSSNDFTNVGRDIVKECGGLPVAIVAIAKALYYELLEDWKATLIRLKSFEPFEHDIVEEDMIKVYNSLRLSYDNLKNNKAQELFLLCSLFPEDYEIPIELLSKISIGLGLCGEADKYSLARSHFQTIKNKLIDSCLLLKAEKECVKLHDLFREVAHLIARTKIQGMIMDSKTTLKENIQYSSWNIDQFPNCFGGSKLEFLLVWVNANSFMEVPHALFDGMMRLRVLLLICRKKDMQAPPLSLAQELLPLRDIRTLILENWNLRDLSILGNLQCLETLELINCAIIEFPNEVGELQKLRLLGLINCTIEQNNPFKAIARSLRLEELYYVANIDEMIVKGNELPQNITLPQLQRYHIVAPWSVDIHNVDASILRCFDPSYSKNIFSEETFKFMAKSATVLQSRGPNKTGWTNLIPDIVRMEDGGMNDLSRLSLDSWSDIECLVNTKHLQPGIVVFSKLVELELFNVNVKELCCGPLPVDFLKQLEKLDLKKCLKLEGTLFKGKLDLGKLKSICLRNCSMTSLFLAPTAQSLKQLEELSIDDCSQLEYVITNNDGDDPNQKYQGTVFPKLKTIYVTSCDELEFILPICFVQDLSLLKDVTIISCEKLKYIFGQYSDEGSLSQKEKEITLGSLLELCVDGVPAFINIFPEWHLPMSFVVQDSLATTREGLNAERGSPSNTFSWTRICCFQPKASATSIDNLPVLDHTSLEESKKEGALNIAKCLLRPPLNPQNLRRIMILGCRNLTSLFTLHIASLMSSLEVLTVKWCKELKHIIRNDGEVGGEKVEDHHHPNQHSLGPMLPKLKYIHLEGCRKLEFALPICSVGDFPLLEDMTIQFCEELSYIYGQYPGERGLHKKEKEVIFPSPKQMKLWRLPKLIAIYPDISSAVQDPSTTSRDVNTSSEALETEVLSNTVQCNLREMEILECPNLTSLFPLPIASSMLLLEKLVVYGCRGLKNIVTDEGAGHDHMRTHSIFPNLRMVVVSHCSLLESLFPASHFRTPLHLESLEIVSAQNLRYVFGKCCCERDLLPQQNQNVDKIHIDLPALTFICLQGVPNMVNIFTEKYSLTAFSLEIIVLKECSLHISRKSLSQVMVGWHDDREEDHARRMEIEKHMLNLKYLDLGVFEIDAIYDLEGLQYAGPLKSSLEFMELVELPKLKYICVGPTNTLSLQSLSQLTITGCKILKVIFSASILRSLPQLKELQVERCEELVHIVEENDQTLVHSRQVCFPQLSSILIRNCKSLKCLFSVSKCDNLPKLKSLTIEDSPELVQVFGCQQDETEHLVVKYVLPKLYQLKLTNLQSLESFCRGIDFQEPLQYKVDSCPKFSLIVSTTAGSSENLALQTDSHLQAALPERDQPPSQSEMEATMKAERDLEIQDQSNSSPNSTKSINEASTEIVEEVSISDIQEMATSSPNSDMLREIPQQTPSLDKLVDEEAKTETTIMDQQALAKARTDMHSNDSKNNIELSATEGRSSKKYAKATSSTHSEPKKMREKEPMDDQEALGESISTNKASRRSNKIALAISSTIAKMKDLAFNPVVTLLFFALLILFLIVIGNPWISSISTLKKPQIGTSTTQIELGSSQPNPSKVSANTASSWDQNMVNQTETYIDKKVKFDHIYSQQFAEDDLIGLFRTMEENFETGAHMPYVSENAALEDDNKVAKAFADIATSLEMGLNEIASSEENSRRLENALNFLFTHFSKHRAFSHGLKATIDSMNQKIQSILSSFKQASAAIHTFTDLEEKEKYFDEELPQRKEAAITLISEISKIEKSMALAQQNKAELKDQISMLQVELNNKEKEIKDCKIKLSLLQEQKKKIVSDTIRFMKEFEPMKTGKSHMMEDQMKARQELEKLEVKWSACVANLKKTTPLLGTHLK